MKMTFKIFILFFFMMVLFACNGSDEVTTTIEFDENNYLTIIDSVWEDYLLDNHRQDGYNIDDIETIDVIGSSYHLDNVEVDNKIHHDFYVYELNIILVSKSDLDIPVQNYNYSLRIGYINDVFSKDFNKTLFDLNDDVIVEDYISSLKTMVLNYKNQMDDDSIEHLSDDAIYMSNIIGDHFEYEDFLVYLPNIDIVDVDPFVYMLYNDEFLSLAWYKGDYEEVELIIPETVDGYSVKIIREHAFRNIVRRSLIKSIVIPASIETIEDYAFDQASPIETITFESDSLLKTIGEYAFSYTAITNIFIPENVEEIGQGAFRVGDLTNIEVAESNKHFKTLDGVLFNHDLSELLVYPIGKTNETYDIPRSVEAIGVSAFESSSLASLLIPNGVKKIKESAFLLSSLETIVFEANSQLTMIGDFAFNLTTMTNVTIPASVEEIGVRAFSIQTLETVTFESNSQLKTIGANAFANTSIQEIVIPASVEEIGSFAFRRSLITNVTFESNSQLKIIGYDVFSDTLITSIIIPASVEEIGESAFAASSLETVTFESNSQLKIMGEDLFFDTLITSIIIPASVEVIGARALASDQLRHIDVEANSSFYQSIDGVLFNEDLTTLVYYPKAKTGNRYEIPASVEEIGEGAFLASSLETITFQSASQLKIINGQAFYNTSIVNMVIPASVEEIGEGAFAHSSLGTITFQSASQLKILGAYALYATAISTITIPASVEEIGQGAFSLSGLESITFESASQLKIIGAKAFKSTSIENIVIPASVEEVGYQVFNDIGSLQVIYAEALEQPEGWDENWNSDQVPVEWAYNQ